MKISTACIKELSFTISYNCVVFTTTFLILYRFLRWKTSLMDFSVKRGAHLLCPLVYSLLLRPQAKVGAVYITTKDWGLNENSPEWQLITFKINVAMPRSESFFFRSIWQLASAPPPSPNNIAYYMLLRAVREIGHKQFVTWFQFRVQVTPRRD